MSAPKGVMKEDQQGTSRVASQGQSVTISALGPSTESPKFRVRHKCGLFLYYFCKCTILVIPINQLLIS